MVIVIPSPLVLLAFFLGAVYAGFLTLGLLWVVELVVWSARFGRWLQERWWVPVLLGFLGAYTFLLVGSVKVTGG